MLEGLEISEVNISRLHEIETFRIDSDYFLKSYIHLQNTIERKADSFIFFDQLGLSVDASAFYPSLEPFYNKGEVPFIRVADVNDFIDYDSCIKIPHDVVNDKNFDTLKTTHKGDIVITKGGSVGRVALIDRHTAVTRDLIFINSSNLEKQDYVCLYMYLMSDFAYKLMFQSSSMTAQPHLTITLIKNLPIFNPTNKLKQRIADIYDRITELRNEAQLLYTQAEKLLLNELVLIDWLPTPETTTIKTFADFTINSRLDAEYYQPQYDELFYKLQKLTCEKLGSIVSIRRSIEPGSDAYQESGIPFIRVSNLSKFELTQPEIHLNRATYEGLVPKPTKDTILLSKDGSVGIAYKVDKDVDAITSGAILHLSITDDSFLPDYLTLVLNSVVVKMQAERDAGGSIIQHWKPSEIENVVIPKLPLNVQETISSKVKESFALREESKRLLELAKTAVEIAIEQNEEVALKYIESHMKA